MMHTTRVAVPSGRTPTIHSRTPTPNLTIAGGDETMTTTLQRGARRARSDQEKEKDAHTSVTMMEI
jgi:hypothetical protein